MKKKPRYDILSPDGFGMYYEKTYSSPDKAWKAFEEWKKRFEMQGYYSSNSGRINLELLKDACELVEM